MTSEQITVVRRGRRFGMAYAHVLDDPRLRPLTKLVYAGLTTHANTDRAARPSIRSLADNLGVSRNTVRAGVDELVEHGWLRVTPVVTGKGRQTDHYELLDDATTHDGGGGSPRDPGVGHHVTQGGSPRDPRSGSPRDPRTEKKEQKNAGARAMHAPATPTPTPPRLATCPSCGRWHPDLIECPTPSARPARLHPCPSCGRWHPDLIECPTPSARRTA